MKKILMLVLIFLLMAQTLLSGYADETIINTDQPFSDIEGHWGETIIKKHYEMGMVVGYPDGTFKPDQEMKRSEMCTLINRYFGLKNKEQDNFEDVSGDEWFVNETAKAKYYGYIAELQAKPEEFARREDIVKMLSLLIDIEEQKIKTEKKEFSDLEGIDEKTSQNIEKFSELGYLKGYKDETFKPKQIINRAEMLSVMENVLGYIVRSQEDMDNLPEDVSKVTIINPNIKVENKEIKGDLYISPGVHGKVTIKDTTIKGHLEIAGGSDKEPIEIENVEVEKVVITKAKETPKVEIKGKNAIGELKTKTETNIDITGETEIKEIKTQAKTELKLDEGTKVENLIVEGETKLEGKKGSEINNLDVKEKAEITGEGEIKKAFIDSEDVKIDKKPEYLEIGNDIDKVQVGEDTVNSKNDDKKDSGYRATIDQADINSTSETELSFTLANAEVGATYQYTISSSEGGTEVTGSGTIETVEDQITGIDVSGLADGALTLTVSLTDATGNQGNDATDTVMKDTTAPSGYSATVDQTDINSTNETALSFTFSNGEVGATYDYTISSSEGGTEVTGSGTIGTAEDQITGIDVSGLADGALTLTVSLTDATGNQGDDATDTVAKATTGSSDITAPSGLRAFIYQLGINSTNEKALSIFVIDGKEGATYDYTISSTGGGTDVTGSGTLLNLNDTKAMIEGIDVSGLGDGTLNLTFSWTDDEGNQGNDATDSVLKDTDGSIPTDLMAWFDQSIIDSTNQTAASFTIMDGEVGATYDYTISSTGGGTEVTGSGTLTSEMEQIQNIDVSGLGDGFLILNAHLTYTSGEQSGTKISNIKKVTTPDTTPPMAGNLGELSTFNITKNSVTLNYTSATDDRNAMDEIEYLIYYSTTSDMDTVEDIEMNGTPFLSAFMGDSNVTGLQSDTTYYFNIIARDKAGNKVAYNKLTAKTLAPPLGGSGTCDDPFRIYKIEDLLKIGQLDSGTTPFDIWYLDKCYILMNDLDFNNDDDYRDPTAKLIYGDNSSFNGVSNYDDTIKVQLTSGRGFQPIGLDKMLNGAQGCDSGSFTGSFDGNGYTISNLYSTVGGLFDRAGEAKIKNLGLINVNINVYGANVPSIGALIGYSRGSIIEKCYVTGKLSTECGSGEGVGGLIGRSVDTVKNCYSEVVVSSSQDYQLGYIGGLIGYMPRDNMYDARIENCYVTGNVTHRGEIGGLVGRFADGIIENCYATGDILAENPMGIRGMESIIGGLVGRLMGTVNNCIAFNTTVTSDITGSRGGRIGCLMDTGIATNVHANSSMITSSDFLPPDQFVDSCDGTDISSMTDTNSEPLLGWDFDTVWEIKSGAIRPTLIGVGNDDGK